jgi:outer membrane protein assembly factor BamB
MRPSKTIILFTMIAISLLMSSCGGPLPVLSWPGLGVDAENNVYISYSSEVLAYKKDSNSILWRFPTTKDANLMFYAEPLVLDNLVIVGDFGKTIYAINKTTGVEEWKFAEAAGHYIAGAIKVGDTILAPSADGTLYALNLATDKEGELLWKFPTQKPLWAKAVSDGKFVYQGSMDHFLYAIDLASGREEWKVDLGAAIVFAPAIAVGATPEDGSTLYAGTIANELVAVRGGKIIWRYTAKGGIWTTPILKDGNLYFADAAGWFHVIRASDKSNMLGPINIGSPILGYAAELPENKGLAYITTNNEVVIVDLDGKVSKYPVSGKLTTGPVVAGDKLLILVSQSTEKLVQYLDFNGLDKGSISPPTQ